MELSAAEIRVLGCLLEKERTTPQLYPMTESAIVTACNQSTNRDPVVSYEQGLVRRTLLDLRQQGLARMVHRPGDRVEKHRHLLDEAWSLAPPQTALLAVLMLRGPQTVGELRTRAERLHNFSSLEAVEDVLRDLASTTPEPFVARLPRQPGQKEARYGHLLAGEDEAVQAAAVATTQTRVSSATSVPQGDDASEVAADRQRSADVITALRTEVAQLRRRVEHLESQLGVSAEDEQSS